MSTDMTLSNIREMTGIGKLPIESVFKRFRRHFQWNGHLISCDKAKGVFGSLIVDAKGFKALKDPGLSEMTAKIFKRFDSNNDGMLDVVEVLAGLSVLCEGTLDRKAKVLFKAADENGDGALDLQETTKLLEAMLGFSILNENHNVNMLAITQMAAVIAQEAFTKCDVNQDGKLTYDEFTTWFHDYNKRKSFPEQNSSMKDVMSAPSQNQLKIWKNMFGLKHFSPTKIFKAFREKCPGDDTKIGFPAFYDVLLKFMTKHHGKWAAKKKNTRNQAFALFCALDTDKNGSVDFHELGGGLCVLCDENPDEIFDVAFMWADVNNDGIITPDEMTLFLEGLFKVLNTNHTTNHTIMSAENRADLYTQQAFEECDINNDGFLDRKELTNYLHRTWEDFTGLKHMAKKDSDRENLNIHDGGEIDDIEEDNSEWNLTIGKMKPDKEEWEHIKEELAHEHEEFHETVPSTLFQAVPSTLSPVSHKNFSAPSPFSTTALSLDETSKTYDYGGPSFQSFIRSPASLKISPKQQKPLVSEKVSSKKVSEKEFFNALENSFTSKTPVNIKVDSKKEKVQQQKEDLDVDNGSKFTYVKTFGHAKTLRSEYERRLKSLDGLSSKANEVNIRLAKYKQYHKDLHSKLKKMKYIDEILEAVLRGIGETNGLIDESLIEGNIEKSLDLNATAFREKFTDLKFAEHFVKKRMKSIDMYLNFKKKIS